MTTSNISVADLRTHLGDTINRAAYGNERILIERRGKATAAIVSAKDLEHFERLEDALDGMLSDQAMAEGKFRDFNDVITELGLDVPKL